MLILWLILLWAVINILGLYWIINHVLFSDNEPMVVLLAPMWSICSNGAKTLELNLLGQILVTIFYTALMLLAVIAYYVLLVIIAVAFGLVMLYALIFRKRNKKY